MTDFDDILKDVGEFGRYQQVVFFVILCLMRYNEAFNSMGIVFLAAVPDHWCSVPSIQHLNLSHDVLMNLTIPTEIRNGAQEYSQCERYDIDFTNWTAADVEAYLQVGSDGGAGLTTCHDGWVYDTSIYESSITTEWDLVCDKQYLSSTVMSVYMAGIMVGGTVFGFISDRFGRRIAYSAALILIVTGSVMSPFSVNYAMFTFCRFLVGAGTLGVGDAGFILGVEMVGQQWRVFVGLSENYFWAAFLMITPLIAYIFNEWRTLAMVYFLPQILNLLVIFFIPESPRWLYSQNRHKEAEVIVRKMAKVNGRTLPDELHVEVKKDPSTGVFLDLVRHKQLRWRTLNMCFQWCTASMVYYGLTLGSSNFGGNPYINFLIGSALELPATVLAHFAVQFFGRRKVHATLMGLSGLLLLAMTLVPAGMTGVEVGLPLTGRFFISAAFLTLSIYAIELFPTVVRNVSISMGSFCGNIGGIIAPYLASMIGISRLIPYLTFGLMALTAGLLGLLLPETKGKKLPELIEDADILNRSRHEYTLDEEQKVQLESQEESL